MLGSVVPHRKAEQFRFSIQTCAQSWQRICPNYHKTLDHLRVLLYYFIFLKNGSSQTNLENKVNVRTIIEQGSVIVTSWFVELCPVLMLRFIYSRYRTVTVHMFVCIFFYSSSLEKKLFLSRHCIYMILWCMRFLPDFAAWDRLRKLNVQI